MPNLGPPELIIIFAILLLLFGARKLPELMRSIGTSVKELRNGLAPDEKKDEPKDERA